MYLVKRKWKRNISCKQQDENKVWDHYGGIYINTTDDTFTHEEVWINVYIGDFWILFICEGFGGWQDPKYC